MHNKYRLHAEIFNIWNHELLSLSNIMLLELIAQFDSETEYSLDKLSTKIEKNKIY